MGPLLLDNLFHVVHFGEVGFVEVDFNEVLDRVKRRLGNLGLRLNLDLVNVHRFFLELNPCLARFTRAAR